MRILALDAGVSSGVAIGEASSDDMTVLFRDQWINESFVDTVETVLELMGEYSVDTLVTERFDLRPGNKFVADLTTVKVNAALQYALYDTSVSWVEQTPAQAKSLITDPVLKRLGWWVTGKQVNYKDANDVRDALRHLGYCGVRTLKLKELTKAGWDFE